MDFGIAHVASQKLTQTGMIMGTTYYMAPEYISGEPVTAASDLFSMGAVLYEVLTGRRPFTGETMQAIIFSVIQHEPAPPSQIDPALPPAIDAIVARALAKDPAGRYPSAREMADALQQVRDVLRGLLPAHPTPAASPVQVTSAAPATPVIPVTRVERLRRSADVDMPRAGMPLVLRGLLVLAVGAGGYFGYLMTAKGLSFDQAIRAANRDGVSLVNKGLVPLGIAPIAPSSSGRSR